MELQVSHCICTKVQETGILWGETAGNRRNTADTVQLEKDKDSGGGSVPRSRAYAVRNTAESISVEFYGIFEGEKQFDDL